MTEPVLALTPTGELRVVASPHPFRTETVDLWVPEGYTISELLVMVQPDPVLLAHAFVFLGEDLIAREFWSRVYPKAGTTITVRVVPTGGGGKNPLRTILMLAVFAAGFVLGPMLGASIFANLPLIGGLPLGLSFGTASLLSGAIGSAIISIGGRLLVNLIAPVSSSSSGQLASEGSVGSSPSLFIEGARNIPRPFGTIPVVLGKHRTIPPMGALSFTEVVGDNQHLRMLVVWGYGPLKIENITIGDTPLANFDDVQIETLEGRPSDPPLTLFPDSVLQQELSILLTEVGSWQQRTTAVDADELSVDIAFPKGLVDFNDRGKRQDQVVAIQIQFRKVGDPIFINPVYSATTVDPSWINGATIIFEHARSEAVRHGFRWPVATRGQYEIQIRRLTEDQGSPNVFDETVWAAIRTITNEDPLNFPHPLAVTALVIKATDQLNRVVDELRADVSSYVLDWNGSSWVEAISSNPASLFRHVLQSKALAEPLADARIDLVKLQDWHDFNVSHGFEFNMVRDFQTSVWDVLSDIAVVGRASPTQVDGKWSVAVDEQQTVPVQHFTPRNSWGFEAEKMFVDPPHGLRIRFTNRNEGWRQDELRVFDDGFTEATATRYEAVDAFGITDPDHIFKFGRFNLAQLRLRPEQWTFNVDVEHVVAKRGSLVVITHDVLLVGLASGRIKALQTDGGGNVTGMTSDEVLTIELGKSYGVSIRTVDDAALTRGIVFDLGDQTTVVFTSVIPVADAPVVGDLFGFGELGSETIEGLVLSIERQSELTARLTVVPHSPAVYNADTGAIPPFDTKLTPVPTIPTAVITRVRSDESVLELGSGTTLLPRIAVTVIAIDRIFVTLPPSFFGGTTLSFLAQVEPVGLKLEAQIRTTGIGEPFVDATVLNRLGGEILLGNVQEGNTYDLRVRWNTEGALIPGAWAVFNNHRVIGQTNPPSGLQNLTISVLGGSVILRWDRLPELDVRFGGEIRFRHSPEPDAALATWQSSTSIGTSASGSDLVAQLPLKPGTYLARVFDRGGRPSIEIAKIDTKQASVLTYANVDSIVEEPVFSGIHTGTIKPNGFIQLTGVGLFDAIPDLDLMTGDLDAFGGIGLTGTYDFAANIDLTTVKKVRLTSKIIALSINVLDKIDDRLNDIDNWEDFDGTVQASTDARVQVRNTDDDPNGSPTWSAWNNLDSAEFEARGFDFRVNLTSDDSAYNIQVSELSVQVEDVP